MKRGGDECPRLAGSGFDVGEVLRGVVLPTTGLCDDPHTLARLAESFASLRVAASRRLASLFGARSAVSSACGARATSLCRLLVTQHPLTHRDFASKWVCDAVGSGCGVEFLEWLVSRFEVAKTDLVRDGECAALREACGTGRRQEARWLVQRFEISRDDILESECLQMALCEGRVVMAHWLVSEGLLPNSFQKVAVLQGSVISSLGNRGDVPGMKFFMEHVVPRMRDPSVVDFLCPLLCSCKSGNVEFCDWAMEAFQDKIKKPDWRKRCWFECCASGSVKMMEWGRDNLCVAVEVMASDFERCVCSYCVIAAQWYAKEFNIHPPSPMERGEADEYFLWLLLSADFSTDRVAPEMVKWLVEWAEVPKDVILRVGFLKHLMELDGGGPVIQWLVEHFNLSCLEACGPRNSILANLLPYEDFETAEWLVSRFSIDRAQALYFHAKTLVAGMLPLARDTYFLRRIVAAGYISRDKMTGQFAKDAFGVACSLGDVGLAKWFFSCAPMSKSCLHLTCSDTVLRGWSPLRFCDSGETEEKLDAVATERLAQSFSLCNALKIVCETGALDMALWLSETFCLTRDDLLGEPYIQHYEQPKLHVIYVTCSTGKLSFVKWLVSQFSLTKSDLVSGGALTGAVASKSIPLITWLVCSFSFPDDLLHSLISPDLDLDLVDALLPRHPLP